MHPTSIRELVDATNRREGAMWPLSFPELVEVAGRYAWSLQYRDATTKYLQAAAAAPDVANETEMLERAWRCVERGQGRRSELEA